MGTEDGATAREVAALVVGLAGTTAGTPDDVARLAGLLGQRFGVADPRLDAGVGLALLETVGRLWARGWTPRDVVEIVRRRLGAAAVGPALDLLAADGAARPRGWGAELAGLGAPVWPEPGSGAGSRVGAGLLGRWRSARGLPASDALRTGLGLLAVLLRLPALPVAGTTASGTTGSGAAGSGPVPGGADAKVLARVRALLAKAESTAFAEEAEALSAKAQELMGRHALERALVDAGTDRETPATARRLWLDAPYVSAKASLVHQVAAANRCRAVGLDGLDLVTVVGHAGDLATVELLVTSLLVQADRAMLAAARSTGAHGRSRTRSFRHAFLLSYATRVGERLAEVTREAEERAVGTVTGGSALVPVLAAREEAVDRTVADLFPRVSTRRFSVGNAAGWHAGRAAADAASLQPGHDPLPRSRERA